MNQRAVTAKQRYEQATPSAGETMALEAFHQARANTVQALGAASVGHYPKAVEYARVAGEYLDAAEKALAVPRVTPADKEGVALIVDRHNAIVCVVCLGIAGVIAVVCAVGHFVFGWF